jgi:3-dehydroquinate dehydratase-2
MRVLVLNGPNLDLLGTREPEVYGSTTLGDLERLIQGWGSDLGIETSFLQTNHEGEIVEAIHGARDLDGILINPGALTHTSRAIGDAIGAVGLPAVEVHISNIRQREPWRSESLVAPACVRSIYGRGVAGYQDGLRHLRNRAAMALETVRYGPHQDNIGDLRSPTGRDALGVVLLIHGGFWRQEYERDTTETLAVDLTEAGFVTWNIEYRRTGDGGGWPGSAHDVLTAFDHMGRDETLRSLPLSLVGHSAGGHLGLWAGARRAEEVGLVVGLAPVTDLTAMTDSDAVGAKEARSLLDAGAPPRSGAVAGKTLLVHGEDDEVVPVTHSTRLAGEARVEVIPGMGHFPLLDPQREHWRLVVEELGKIPRGRF